MLASAQSLKSDKVAADSQVRLAEVEQITLQNCLANAPTAALSNMVPITLIGLSCFSIPHGTLMGLLLTVQLAINLFKLTFSRRIKSTNNRTALRIYEAVLGLSGAVWGAMLLPLAATRFLTVTASVIFVLLIGTIAITSMALASQRRFFTAFILGFAATSVPIALIHIDMVGIMPNLALLGFIFVLDAMTKASLKQGREHILGQIENQYLAKQLAAALHEAEYLANSDSLTGLLNRRAFNTQAAQMERVGIDGAALRHIILLDLDHFKSINDTFGHAVGDEVLQRTAANIQEALSRLAIAHNIDASAARWGGEEFIILLDACPLEQAMTFAESLRHKLLTQRAAHWPHTMVVSASFGVAPWPFSDDLFAVINAADKAMYRAKNAGRNRICLATVDGGQLAPTGDVQPMRALLLRA